MNYRTIILVFIASIFMLIVGSYVYWIVQHTRIVRLIVPDTFRGLIRVYPDAKGVKYSGTIIVPSNGEIPAIDILNDVDWQIIFAKWQSGKKLEIKQISDKDDGNIYLWELSDAGGPTYFFFVGTWAEFVSYHKVNKDKMYGPW